MSAAMAIATCSSYALPPYPTLYNNGNSKSVRRRLVVLASRREAEAAGHQNYGGRIVDESMIVLRKRIHEMKVIERNYEPPSDWMDWEKSYYACYDSMICGAVGILQSHLMNTRPSLALGLIALLAFSVPTSVTLLFFHFIHIAQPLLDPIHFPR